MPDVDRPVTAYVGANGAGKTLAMVEDLAVPVLDRHDACRCGRCDGVPLSILANFTVASTNFVPLRSWRQVVLAHNARILFDEISSVLPSRQAMSVPPQLVRVLNQLRKQQCVVGWTAPAWARCDTVLREVTWDVAVCRGYWRDRWQREPSVCHFPGRGRVLRDDDGRLLRAPKGWEPRCLFSVVYYDARDMDEFSYGCVSQVKARRKRWYWRPGHQAHCCYHTREGVDLLDHLDDYGTCLTCGGTRSRRRCACKLESPFEAEGVDLRPVEVPGSVDSAFRAARPGRARRRREDDGLVVAAADGDVGSGGRTGLARRP